MLATRRLGSALLITGQSTAALCNRFQPARSSSSDEQPPSDTSSHGNLYDRQFQAPSPFRRLPPSKRFGYSPKFFTGGLLPRLKRRKENHIGEARLPAYELEDPWGPAEATFGQNDYIDLLGDGSVHPVDLMRGPVYLRGFRGNELQRLVRRLDYEGERLKLEEPSEYAEVAKRINFLYKKLRRRKYEQWQFEPDWQKGEQYKPYNQQIPP